MQKTSLAILLTISGLTCTAAIGALHLHHWPKPLVRQTAAIQDIGDEEQAQLQIQEVEIQPRSYKIASSFRRSRAIWGVYDKTSDRLEALEQKDIKPHIIKTKLGELILKNGQVVLVSPLSEGVNTHIEVAKLPYTKKSKNHYVIDLANAGRQEKAALARLYQPLLNNIETYENAEVTMMDCHKKKSQFACELSIQVH